jgi:hypothetical protein
VEGISCPASVWDVHRTYSAVSGALIRGFDYQQQHRLIQGDPEEWSHFVGRLFSAFRKWRRGEKSFDRWFRVEHGQGLWRLLPSGSRLPQDKRDAARCRASAYYRHLLWAAYQGLSRSYGAVMFVAWLSFGLSEVICPTAVEKLLFRQLHAPQLYLAGLPLVFFPPSQLWWILRPLLQNWNRECFLPQWYSKFPSILGLYGLAIDSLRAHDRVKKQRQRAAAVKGQPSPRSSRKASPRYPKDGDVLLNSGGAGPDVACTDLAPELDDPLRFPLREDSTCLDCGMKTIRVGSCSRLDDWLIVGVHCPRCQSDTTVRFRLPGES